MDDEKGRAAGADGMATPTPEPPLLQVAAAAMFSPARRRPLPASPAEKKDGMEVGKGREHGGGGGTREMEWANGGDMGAGDLLPLPFLGV